MSMQMHTLHRGAFCQLTFRWIYYCHSNKSTSNVYAWINKKKIHWTQTFHFIFFSIPGVSSSPGRPTIELSSRMNGTDMQDGVTDEINLKWLVPQDDGGFPITGIGVSVYKPRFVLFCDSWNFWKNTTVLEIFY